MSEKHRPPETPRSAEDAAFEAYEGEREKQQRLQENLGAIDEALDLLHRDEHRIDPAVMKLITDYKKAMEERRAQKRHVSELGRKLERALRKRAEEDIADRREIDDLLKRIAERKPWEEDEEE